MWTLAYSHVTVAWSLAQDHELSTGRRQTLQRSAISASVNFEMLLLCSLHSWFCILHLSGLFGRKGLREACDKATKASTLPLSTTEHPARGFTHRRTEKRYSLV